MTLELQGEQKLIFDKYVEGDNIFITGPGGTGKTHLIKSIVAHAKENNKSYKVCALTGCAAILLMCGATTLHAFAGIGLATGSINQVVDRVVSNRYKKANWQKLKILIVDEVSMLSLKLFMILDLIGRRAKKNRDVPFGGIQVIFSGDFYQLPPVGDEQEPETVQFCFETPLWNETFKLQNQIQMTTMFRQTDPKYIKILNGLRVGKITNTTISTLNGRVKKYENDIRPTILLPRRYDADVINYKELVKLDIATEKIFTVATVPDEDLTLTKEQIVNLTLFTDKEREYEVNYLMNNILPEKEIKLRIGAIVMCIANLNMDGETPIVNGSQGIITEFIDNYPKVLFDNGVSLIICPHIWNSEKIPGIAIKQLPLIYAWAITIHKSQGLSLDRASIDIGEGIFECGQTYVALSRIKSLEGVYLTSFDYSRIKVNKSVQNFYSRFK